MWIDISHTVKAAELKGGRLEKNLHTGETRFISLPEPEVEVPPEMPTTMAEIVATTVENRKGKKRDS